MLVESIHEILEETKMKNPNQQNPNQPEARASSSGGNQPGHSRAGTGSGQQQRQGGDQPGQQGGQQSAARTSKPLTFHPLTACFRGPRRSGGAVSFDELVCTAAAAAPCTFSPRLAPAYAFAMATAALPLFHLYGDPPDDQAFDFIHIETISSRSSVHDWTIRAHRHRNLFQILLIEHGGGEMTFEAATLSFEAPCAILVPATVAHGFRFHPRSPTAG